MKYLQLVLAFISLPILVHSQTININFPSESNKSYVFTINKGIEQDTIQQGYFSAAGSATIHPPIEYKGMGMLYINNQPPIILVVNNESFEVREKSKKLSFTNSPENNYLYTVIQELKLPQPDSTLYAYKFLNIVSYSGLLNKASQKETTPEEQAQLADYALNNIDYQNLYNSSLWYYVIDGLAQLNNPQLFTTTMLQILDKIEDGGIYEHLTENLINITRQQGWNDAFDRIVTHAQESGKIKTPKGDVYTAFTLVKLKKGEKAPLLDGLNKGFGKTNESQIMLIFFDSECFSCNIELENIIKEYPSLQMQNIRIISISADTEKKAYEEYEKKLPWSDKLCDFEGFAGKNFINYGILGTPTFFILDNNGKLIGRYDSFSEIAL